MVWEAFKVLVAVDLADGHSLVSPAGRPHSRHAVQEALWLARGRGAKLTFFHALDISEKAQRLIELDQGMERTLLDEARESLQRMVDRAAADGIEADCDVVFGRSWQQIIRKVVDGDYDLVLAGTRRQRRLRSAVVGSTGMKLLRKCPVPVWLTHPRQERQLRTVVVATDFSEVSNRSVDAAALVAREYDAQLHILHVIEPRTISQLRGSGVKAVMLAEHEQQERERAEEQLRLQVGRPSVTALQSPPEVLLRTGEADEEILDALDEVKADVLVMATIGRSGIPGMVIGNTAERLLPHLRCSVLAVKPEGFVSPATP